MKIEKIGFIGFGLIGGSIGKAIKKTHPNIQMYGHASHRDTLKAAHMTGIIENDDFLPLESFGKMDIIFLCSPVRTNVSYVSRLMPHLSEYTLLTDVGSVKGEIHKEVDRLGLSGQFIGGHPMTGSEKMGFDHSDASLLENAYYILTSDKEMGAKLLKDFMHFIASLGPITLSLSPEDHDFATAAISHLPHIVSASLVNLAKDNDPLNILKTIAAGGFRDITRISSSSPVMWQNICIENKTQILRLLSLYQEELKEFAAAIQSENEADILQKFTSAKDFRDSLPIKKASLLPQVYAFYVDLKDETGEIAKVSALLARENISIKNIGIINNREFEDGVLRVEVETNADTEASIAILNASGYQTFPVK